MNASAGFHPTDQTLQEYGLGKLDDASAGSIDAHLETCPDCQRRVSELSGDSFLGRLRKAEGHPQRTVAERVPASAKEAGLPPELADHPQYEVIRELGRGGMGIVYLARNRLLDRLEVLKVLSREMLDRRGTVDRFLREIRSAAKLSHQNVVGAYSALQVGRLFVFAMEYVEGEDLAKLVRKSGRLPVPHACYFVHQAAQGLQHAHERGMVHRDIKPGNLILSRQGARAVVKVLDFGLAKATREDPLDAALTHEGQMLGTPDYIAPEQTLDAQKADIRADVYSLGCTLYYLLTGGPPFRGSSLYDVLQSHHSVEAKPLNLVRPDVPVELAAVVGKMMAKDVGRRYQTPAEVARALAPFFKPGGATASPSRRTPAADVPTNPDLAEVGAASPPSPPATADAASAIASKPPVDEPRTEARWESLIEFRETERAVTVPPAIASGTVRPRRWRWPAAVALLLLGLGIAWASVVLWVKTKDGTLVLEGLPPQAEVRVYGEKVAVRWPEGGGPAEVTVHAGEVRVEVRKDGFRVFTDEVPLEAGTKVPVRVRLIPAVATNPGPAAAPDPSTIPAPTATGSPTPAASPLPASGAAPGGSSVSGNPLFNGKDLVGWTAYDTFGATNAADAARTWWVREGALHGVGGRSHLFSPRGDYTNVRVRAEVRINDGGNSGLFLRAQKGSNFPKGYEVQINSTHRDDRKTGSLYGGPVAITIASSAVPPDTWFTLEAEAVGNRIRTWVNGKPLVDWTDPEGRYTQGHIALQAFDPLCHVEFRALAVTELDALGKPIAAPAGPAVAATAGARSSDGFLALFDGNDLSGWAGAVDDYEVVGAALRCKLGRQTTIYYPKELSDFVARVEFRLASGGNSGLAIRYPGAGDPSTDGFCEIQVLDDSSPKYAGLDPRSYHGSAYGMVAARRGFLRPLGEWNAQEVTVRGTTVKVELNGMVILDADLAQVRAFKNQVPHPGKDRRSGYFGLFGIDSSVEYRRIEIRELEPPSRPSRPRANTDGWAALFNGKDLTGWKPHPAGAGSWTVEGGEIVGRGTDQSLLFTDSGSYANFRVRVEAKINAGGNAALGFRSAFFAKGTLKGNGYEAEIDASNPQWMTGSLMHFGPAGQVKRMLVKPGEWFTLEVIAAGNRIMIKVNGTTTVNFLDPDRMHSSGHLALQQRGARTEVRFRSVEIKEIAYGVQPPEFAAVPAPHPVDAKKFQGKYYKVYPVQLSWHMARARCRELGGHLAIVSDARENRFIATLLASQGISEAWLGATDEQQEGRWLWVDGTELRYGAWDRGQPNNRSPQGEAEHYLILLLSRNAAWWDQPARSEPRWHPGFVCQWD